jgi:hypothetical protein
MFRYLKCTTCICSCVQSTFERALLWCLMWGPDERLRTVVVKNLAGHVNRNRKTAYMVSIAVAFIIFAGAMFTLQTKSIQDTVRMILGADLIVLSAGSAGSHSLPQVSRDLNTVTPSHWLSFSERFSTISCRVRCIVVVPSFD